MGNDFNDDRFNTGENHTDADSSQEGYHADEGAGADPDAGNTPETPADENAAGGSSGGDENSDYSPYGGNVQYKWNYDDYQRALGEQQKTDGRKPRGKNRGLRVFVVSVATLFVLGMLGLAGVGLTYMIKDGRMPWIGSSSAASSVSGGANSAALMQTQSKPETSTASSQSSSATTTPIQMSATQVVKAVKNSIVTIETYTSQSFDVSAEGSGIIESKDGYILTNEHVIDGATNIAVVTSDGKSYTAKLIGKDMRTDLAVVKIDASNLTAATFGNSDQLEVGETVLAIGNPGGIEFSGSVSTGIVSAVDRDVPVGESESYTLKCIQTDAAINPGNSGGALVNMYGQVVGITSSKIEATGYEGMGFAIPVNTAKPIVNDLIQYGYVQNRVKIGLSVTPINSAEATAYGVPAGLAVANVDKSSDAYGKLQTNDIITKIDGTDVTSYDQFYTKMSAHKAGDSVTLTVYRYTTKNTFQVSVKLQQDKGDESSTSSSSTTQQTNPYQQYSSGSGGYSSGSQNPFSGYGY